MTHRFAMVLQSLAVCGVLAACGGSGDGASPPIVIQGTGVERIESAMTGVMNRYAPPGIAVAVAYDDRLVFAAAYGSADIAGNQALRPDNLFRVASVSKPITGIAVLKAAEDGLLDLDAAAFDILSNFVPAGGADDRLGDITVWQLLHHTSGWDLWDYPQDPLFRSREIANDLGVAMPPDPQALTRWIAKQPLASDPGSTYAYSNIEFVVLGRIIEQSSGFAYEDFVEQFVMAPAGIRDASLAGITRAERLPGEVEYESFGNDIWKSVFDGTSAVPEPAYGGINLRGFDASSAWVISAIDLVRLTAAVDGNPAYPDILTPNSIDAMLRVGTPAGQPALGVAWFLGTDGVGNVVAWEHAGAMPGTTAYLGRTRNGAIVAALSNTAREQAFLDDLAGRLVEAVEGITAWPDTDLFPAYGQ